MVPSYAELILYLVKYEENVSESSSHSPTFPIKQLIPAHLLAHLAFARL
jgi:hypothetical protein